MDKIELMMNEGQFEKTLFFGEVFVLACKLGNGFVVTGKAEYDKEKEDVVYALCLKQIKEQLIELEKYKNK